MSDHLSVDDFRQFVNEVADVTAFPVILWDDDGQPNMKGISGEELLSACWIAAHERGLQINQLSHEEIKSLAWKSYNDDRSVIGKVSKKGFLNYGISEAITRCQRTVDILGSSFLSPDQKHALLAGSITDIATERGCRRSSATTLRKRALVNLGELVSIDELLHEDWPRWFEQNASSWRAPFLRKTIWPYIKPGSSSDAVRTILASRQQEMFETGIRMLAEESRRGSTAVADRIAQGYHLCVAATYIDPRKATDAVAEMNAVLPRLGPLYHKITERCLHLLRDDEERLRYLHSLESYLADDDVGGEFFARYACVYYGGTTLESERRFLGTHGLEAVEVSNSEAAVCESYANLTELQYRESNLLDDINFLRCILIIRRLQLDDHLRRSSWLKLRVLAQHARKSKRRSVHLLGTEVTRLCEQRI